MEEIEERAIEKFCTNCGGRLECNCSAKTMPCHRVKNYIKGATEQAEIDHSEEHLNWIIKQHENWSYEMWHCDNNEQCSFKEWIDRALQETE